MQNFRTLGLIIKKVRELVTLTHKYWKIIQCALNINLEERYKFSCSFDNIKNYPFGLQSCSLSVFIKGTDNNRTNLIPEKFINKGPKEIGQFLIHDWRMEGKFDEITERKIISIQLGNC